MAERQLNVKGYLDEKRGIYQMVLAWYEDGKRQRKTISTKLPVKGNKGRAEIMLRDECIKLEKILNSSEYVSVTEKQSKILFADFLLVWLKSVKGELEATTYGAHQSAIQRTINPYFNGKGFYLNKVISDDILEFYDEQLKRVKATTVHKYHNIFSRAFRYAVEKELITDNPMEKVKRPRAERFAAKFLKQSEAVELFEAIKGHKLELGVILAGFYGLRRGEIVGLRWESIDFEKNTITVEHTVTVAQVDGKKTIIKKDTGKTKTSLRTLPLVPQFRSKLLALKEEKERNERLCGKSYNKKEGHYIYTDVLGNLIRPDYLTAEFPIWLEKNGFRRLRFHDLRHSCASLLLANGVPLKQIQDWLGHSSFKITADAYAHLDYESKISAANAMTWIGKTSLGTPAPQS